MNWEQLKTILWLRWRLTRNQWTKSGGLGLVLSTVVAIAMLSLGGLSFLGGLAGGAFGLGKVKPMVIFGIWFGLTVGFLFLWLVGLLAELQRAETIDLQRLMHLPVALGQMFVINYLASHLALSIVLLVPAMTGLALGLVLSRGPLMLLVLPLAWGMVFMISAWTYCLRGWLATMMSNPRRRRTIIMAITVGFILTVQLPNLYFNVFRNHHPPRPTPGATPESAERDRIARQTAEEQKLARLVAWQRFIPPLWLPYGVLRLAEQQALPALLGTLGCTGMGLLGLRRAYRSTVRFYQGETGAKAAVRKIVPAESAAPAAPAGRTMVEARLPGIPEAAAAVALASLRSMLRAPEVKFAWGTSFLVTLVIGAGAMFRTAPKLPEAVKPFVVTGALTFSIFMLVQFLANQFGFDRQGFRAFVLSPVERRLILLGKNLATWPVGASFGLLLLIILAVWLRLSLSTVLAGMLQLVTLLALSSLGGNLLSILVPFRVEAGSLKPTKMPALATIVMVVCQMLFPLILTPLFLPALAGWLWERAGWSADVPVNLLLSLPLAILASALYWFTLAPLGRLLHSREIKILNTVTAEQE